MAGKKTPVACKKATVASKSTPVATALAAGVTPASANGGGVENHLHLVFKCQGAAHISSCSAMKNPTSDTTPPPFGGSCTVSGGLFSCTHPY